MTQPRRSRRQPRAGRTSKDLRAALLESAERLLAERPLADLAVEDLLSDAGVSRASFYFYFESKHAKVAALLERIVDDVHGAALPWFERGDTPPKEALHAALSGSLALWRRHSTVMSASVEHWQSVPELREVWGGVIARFTDAAAAQIERDRETGAAPPGADPHTLAGVLVAMNERSFYYAISAGDPADDPKLVDTLTGVWLASIYGVTRARP
ncbi:MAG TPA: TetR/AcrR family transcriptional regulator [Solirubrobacteraceae bacterium]|jgi:AcrR family transcriptional regulator